MLKLETVLSFFINYMTIGTCGWNVWV